MKKYLEEEKEKCWYKTICNNSKCNDFCIRHYKMDRLINLALLEGKQRYPLKIRTMKGSLEKDFEKYEQLNHIKLNIKDFVANGKNLFIYSEKTGNSKTKWSQKLLLAYLNTIWYETDLECRALFVSLPRLMGAMKDNIGQLNNYYNYVNENIYNADLVVFDEMNYKDFTTFEHDYLLNIISQRIAEGKSNIYTSNYDLDKIKEKLGTRLASRVLNESILIEFKNDDRRGAFNDI